MKLLENILTQMSRVKKAQRQFFLPTTCRKPFPCRYRFMKSWKTSIV